MTIVPVPPNIGSSSLNKIKEEAEERPEPKNEGVIAFPLGKAHANLRTQSKEPATATLQLDGLIRQGTKGVSESIPQPPPDAIEEDTAQEQDQRQQMRQQKRLLTIAVGQLLEADDEFNLAQAEAVERQAAALV